MVSFQNRVIEAAAECGYTIGFASVPGDARELGHFNDALKIYPRNLVQFSPLSEFAGVLNGAMTPLQQDYLKRHFVKE